MDPKKKMKYSHSLGQVTFETTLFSGHDRKTAIINGSVLQGSVILLFNSTDTMTFAEIWEKLQVRDSGTADRAVSLHSNTLVYAAALSLLMDKAPLLKKESSSEGISSQDVLSLNEGFVAGRKTIRLPAPRQIFYEEGLKFKDFLEDDEALLEKEDELWLYKCVEAVVVKMMKDKEREKFNTLFKEVVAYGRRKKPRKTCFETSMKLFKKVIETLLDDNCLAREPADNAALVYVR